MKRLTVSLIALFISGLILLTGSLPAMAIPASDGNPAQHQPGKASPPVHNPQVHNPQEFLHWFKQCEHLQGQAALMACEQALKINPHIAATWINHGQKLFGFGQYTKALASFDAALFLKPDYSLGLANRCGLLSVLGRYSEALDACDMALIGDQQWGFSGQVLAWNNRGDTLIKLERYEEALASFQKSLAIDPNDAAAQQYRHVVLQKLHRQNSDPPKFPDLAPSQQKTRIALVTH